MKVKIDTTSQQPITQGQFEKLVEYAKVFEKDGSQCTFDCGSIDGAYADDMEKFREMFPNVSLEALKEYVRLDTWDSGFVDFLKSSFSYITDNVTRDELDRITSLPTMNGNKTINSLVDLIEMPKMTMFSNNDNWYANTVITSFCTKWIQSIGRSLGMNMSKQIKRWVFPSIKTIGALSPRESNLTIFDVGPNLTSWGSASFYNTTATLVIRNNSACPSGIAFSNPTFVNIFVPISMVDTYKATSPWSNYADKIFPIGGPTWASTFGSTDPYADLTPEEKSWYEELFPTLYEGWIAPTED